MDSGTSTPLLIAETLKGSARRKNVLPRRYRLSSTLPAWIRQRRCTLCVSEAIKLPELLPAAAFERVRLRSLGADDELRNAEGGGLSDAEFAALLGIKSREIIPQYRKTNRIFGWLKDLRSYRYPAWQIHRGRLLPGLEMIIEILTNKELEPLAMISYFLTPSSDLDARPLDLLRKGRVEEVVADAERYGDTGG
jgi:hypothetical protein